MAQKIDLRASWCMFELCNSDFRCATRHSAWYSIINDMQDNLECTPRLFADDALLYHKITHNDDTLALQNYLDGLGLWAEKWHMLYMQSFKVL